MDGQDPPPLTLRIVAALFVFGAVLAVIHIGDGLLHAKLNFDLGVLGFWLAPGLLRGDRTWRLWALVLSWIGLVGSAIGSAVVLLKDVPLELNVLHYHRTGAPTWIWFTVAVPGMLMAAFQLWVLTRPAIRRRFERAERPGQSAPAIPV